MAAPALLLSLPALAQAPYRATDATVKFAGRVTLIPVNGTADALSSATSLDFANLNATKAMVSVDLTTLKTGIGLRDQHAKEALGAAEHPQAVFTLNSFTGASSIAAGQTLKGQVTGTFALKGMTKPLTAPVTLTRTGDRLNVSTEFVIHPHEHGVVVRGADQTTTVTVNFSLTPGS
ncbi:YceI family protein [Deinococcus sp.]|uniref:YceI family protein n=1 Tax=Deinococcus sp. TaxID=47478 RepID=UPI002869AE3E|nr:YceI family protein [Deinococcus sp.]